MARRAALVQILAFGLSVYSLHVLTGFFPPSGNMHVCLTGTFKSPFGVYVGKAVGTVMDWLSLVYPFALSPLYSMNRFKLPVTLDYYLANVEKG